MRGQGFIRSKYDEPRNRIHARNGKSKLSTVSLHRFLAITLRSTRVDYVLCGYGCCSLSNVESNKSKCCPALPGAWVPANASTVFITDVLCNWSMHNFSNHRPV